MPPKTTIKPGYFDVLNERSAYILGLFMSDGVVKYYKDMPHEAVLYSKDPLVLGMILSEIGLDQEVKKRENLYLIRFCSAEFCRDLVRLGVCRHKKTEWKDPDVPPKLMRHFIRGYFDGMGNVVWEKNQGEFKRISTILYSHTWEGMSFVLDWLVANGMTRAHILKKGNGRYHIRYKISNSIKLISLLYWKATIFRSDRKAKIEFCMRRMQGGNREVE